MTRQDEEARRAAAAAARLAADCCPTHGIPMPQVGVETDDGGDPIGTIIGCPRKDCSFTHVLFEHELAARNRVRLRLVDAE